MFIKPTPSLLCTLVGGADHCGLRSLRRAITVPLVAPSYKAHPQKGIWIKGKQVLASYPAIFPSEWPGMFEFFMLLILFFGSFGQTGLHPAVKRIQITTVSSTPQFLTWGTG